jgi:ATP synthase protein I
MNEPEEPRSTKPGSVFSHQVGLKEERKLKAKSNASRSVWLGFGAFGIIGWSVALPTLVGVAFGLWLDHRYPGKASWTLTLMIAGLAIGCWVAWSWVARENKEIRKD